MKRVRRSVMWAADMRAVVLLLTVWIGLMGPIAVGTAQGRCGLVAGPLSSAPSAAFPAADFVFYDPPCDVVPGVYEGTETIVIPHRWPLPGGAVRVTTDAGLGLCHGIRTVRHTRGRSIGYDSPSMGSSVNLDTATCSQLRSLATGRRGTAFTVESSWGQSFPEQYLRAEHVETIGAVGGAELILDVAVRRSED